MDHGSCLDDFCLIAAHFQTQKIRSAGVSLRRFGADRRKTASCCRKARFSSRSWAEVLTELSLNVPWLVALKHIHGSVGEDCPSK